MKCSTRQAFLVLGWTPPRGNRRGIGTLHLGYHDDQGRLRYAGGVGTGFTEQELEAFRALLTGLETSAPADLLFAGDSIDPLVTWVRPQIVVEIRFTAWTDAGRVRHPI